MRIQHVLVLVALVSFGWSSVAMAVPNPPTGSERIVYLRNDCGTAPDQQEDCFETMSATNAWLWNTRNPTEGDSVTVEIGPGEFTHFSCPMDRGWVTLKGAGRERTTLRTHGGVGLGGQAFSCFGLEFIDLRFEGANFGFIWTGTGSSSWTDVDIVGVRDPEDPADFFTLGWVSNPCTSLDPGESPPVHYFFGSRVIARGDIGGGYPAAAFWEECGESWFYGGEIRREIDVAGDGSTVDLRGPGSTFHAFGTAIRFVGPDAIGVYGQLVLLGDPLIPDGPGGPQFHMHGGIMSMILPNAAGFGWGIKNDVIGGFAHTPATAFNFKASSATFQRTATVAGATTNSPFVWQAGVFPPVATSETNVIGSETGTGMFVETDCNAAGNCSSGGSETHLMIYNDALCPAGNPWFDTVTGACRL